MRRPAARQKHIIDEDDTNPEDWELRYRSKTNGRENRVIFYCRSCGHQEQPQPWPLQQISAGHSRCPVCQASMFFVAYLDGWENGLAKLVIETGGLGE